MIDTLLEKDLVPDRLVRLGIRRLLAQRLRDEAAQYQREAYVADLKTRPIAEQTKAANEQHYEVPTAFYQLCLGRNLKYSGCLYPQGTESLDEAEAHMLARYVERARITDGQTILELGCGWGSLSMYLAERFPRSRITGVSNSRTQREYIEAEAKRRGLANLRIVTCDMNTFDAPAGHFDRVVSVEMFEHMKNWPRLMAAIAGWLRPGGHFFAHVFTHARFAYHFVARDQTDWMSRYFFTGGMMPAHGLFPRFQDDLKLVSDWKVNGRHYAQTAELWLKNMDAHEAEILPLFEQTYGAAEAAKWWSYWRVFYLACAELWWFRGGEEWHVSHYLFKKP